MKTVNPVWVSIKRFFDTVEASDNASDRIMRLLTDAGEEIHSLTEELTQIKSALADAMLKRISKESGT